MRIEFIGRGVIATTYAWAFAQAGHQVSHLVRPGRGPELGRPLELDLLDCRPAEPGAKPPRRALPVASSYTPACSEDWSELGQADLAVISLRHDQLDQVAAQLRAAPRPRRGLLWFNNCWQDPQAIMDRVDACPALWGFPVAGGGFAPGGQRLIASLLPQVHLSAPTPGTRELHQAIGQLLASTRLQIEEHPDMKAWLWRHFAVNAGLVAAAAGAGTNAVGLLAERRLIKQGLKLGREAIKVAEARGIAARAEAQESLITRLPGCLASRILQGIAAGQPSVRRIMSAHANPRELALFPLDVLAEARKLGIHCPLLAASETSLRRVAEARETP